MNRLEKKDFEQLSQRGISEKQIERQLAQFATGFPFLKIEAAATIGHGMMAVDANGRKEFIDKWHAYKKSGDHRILKFVPASGAASRMFKDMFEFLQAENVGRGFLQVLQDVRQADVERVYVPAGDVHGAVFRVSIFVSSGRMFALNHGFRAFSIRSFYA